MNYKHIPVMLEESITYLKPKVGGFFVDCTLGGGGYTRRLSEAVGDSGRVIAIDADKMALKNSSKVLADLKNVTILEGNFKNLATLLPEALDGHQLDGIVMDLGLSSAQLDDDQRGFSFNSDGPLDMAFGSETIYSKNAEDIINTYKEVDLMRMFRDYGEEDKAFKIVKGIVSARKVKPIRTAKELADIICDLIKNKPGKKFIHPATKVFQALRIAVNGELDNLSVALESSSGFLKESGRLVVVSYHSLEDRIVKNFLRKESKDCLCPPSFPVCNCGHKAKFKILTKKPILPSEKEIEVNPRARSAKLRAAEKI